MSHGTAKFWCLTRQEKALVFQSALLLTAISAGLRVSSFKRLRSVLGRLSRKAGRAGESQFPDWERIETALRAMNRADRYIPWKTTCLTRALAGEVLLKRIGESPRLRIGVVKGERANVEAHAWLEVDGKAVVGGNEDLSRYASLPAFETDGV